MLQRTQHMKEGMTPTLQNLANTRS